MNIPPKYEDLVLKVADLERSEAALREELAALRESYEAMRDRKNSIVDLQQRLTVAERRESEAREELLELSRKLDVFYSRSHGIKNLSAIEDANDKSKDLQQRLTVAEQLLHEVRDSGDWHSSALEFIHGEGFEVLAKIEAALKPAAEVEALGARPVGCCCPPKGHTGIWAAAMCPVHFGLKRPGVSHDQ